MYIEFHASNTNTKLFLFPLPCIADLLDKLGKAKYFSCIDLATAYHLVRIAQFDMQKTIFLTNKGLYKYILMIFGLYNASITF